MSDQPPPTAPRIFSIPTQTLDAIFKYTFQAIGLAIFGLIGLGIFSSGGSFLESLESTETARGLITFLVALATVTIAITLALYAILGKATPDDGEDLKTRFTFGKEILTTLIGVLGTIIGFYFGSAINSNGESSVFAEPLSVSNETPTLGDVVTVESLVRGGKPPYSYTIVFSPESFAKPIMRTSQYGAIREQFTVPKTLGNDLREVSLKLQVIDSAGNSAGENNVRRISIQE